MTVWLYQMNAKKPLEGSLYTPDDYRIDVESKKCRHWHTKVIRPGEIEPKAGDTLLYWFVAKGTDQPGLYGLGVIFDCYENLEDNYNYNKYINHLPVFPSEILSNNPIYDDETQKIVNEIRRNQPNFGTMFAIDDNHTERLLAKVRDWSKLEEE